MDRAQLIRQRSRRGFTLIEILMVVGIIAVLIGLLITVRSRVSDKAAQTMCVSNLRQLGLAMMMYAQENNQVFPFSSPRGGGPNAKEDWIHWRGTDLAQEINKSAIAPYVKAKGEAFQALMRCPSDDWENHRNPYPYSYTMSWLMTPDRGKVTPTSPTPRATAMPRPSQKIILAEENELTINDGLWSPVTAAAGGTWRIGPDYLSIRHDSKKGEFEDPTQGPMDRRGNVVFIDGHSDYVTRTFAHDEKNLIPTMP